jgi:hypothetical protein
MDTGEWVTSAIAVLALLISVVALVIAVRSGRIRKASSAGAAAEISEPVAETAVTETAVTETAAVIVPPAPPEGVAWKIEHDAGITWRLRNIGTEGAFDVNAVGLPAESAGLVRLAKSFADVPTNGSLSFHVVRTASHPNVTGLAVTWSGQEQPVIVTMD